MKDNDGIQIKNLTVNYNGKEAVRNVSLSIPSKQVTAIIGPSGCGKSTLLRSINRMNDFITNCTTKGEVIINGKNIYSEDINPTLLRKYVGMVFQKPNPFPKSIFANVSWAVKLHKIAKSKKELYQIVKNSLKQAALWEEVGDRLYDSALSLSGGQQQRLCIARALAIRPKILLMDEPCSALDPKSTYRIEELIEDLKNDYTIVIVTHNMQQAARVSDYTAFLYNGELIEVDKTEEIFKKPKDKRTEDYITGRFG